ALAAETIAAPTKQIFPERRSLPSQARRPVLTKSDSAPHKETKARRDRREFGCFEREATRWLPDTSRVASAQGRLRHVRTSVPAQARWKSQIPSAPLRVYRSLPTPLPAAGGAEAMMGCGVFLSQ